ncbi:MAG TPA: hypothetical protein VKT72_13060 [Candidatus Baltobacteraceae bacterium]|nr:hypothetical protein [Candidatus Baltobacteraceae bacterium]
MKQSDNERLLKRWREIIDHVRGQLSDLLWQREQIRRIGKMIEENPRLLASDKPFLWDARRWYMFFAVMRIRSQADNDEDVYSLRRVLEEMREHPECFSESYALELIQKDGQHLDSGFVQTLADGLWNDFRTDGGDFDTAALDADIQHLHDISKEVRRLANKSIAHVTKQGILNEPKLTFDDLDKCIDAFDAITVKYIVLLTGGAYSGGTLMPTEQFDWYEEFSFPWKPREEGNWPGDSFE